MINIFSKLKPVLINEINDLISSAKQEPTEVKNNLTYLISDFKQRLGNFFSLYNLRFSLITFFSTVILGLLFSLFCSLKEGGLDLFLTAMIPFILICMIFFLFTLFYNSSLSYAVSSVILIMFGFAFQTLLKLPAKEDVLPTETSLIINAVLGIIIGLIAFPIIYCLLSGSNKKLSIYLLLLASVFFYLVLLVAAPDVSGTKAWLIIHGRSFQLTEITKVFAVIGISVSFTNVGINYKKRLLYAIMTLITHAAFLVLINELGTLVVIFIAFCVLGFTYQPKIRYLLFTLLIGLMLIAAGLTVSWYCYHICYELPEQTQSSVEDNFESSYDDTSNTAIEGTTENSAFTKLKDNKIVKKAANIFYKIKLRFILVLDPDSVDPYGDGYQSTMARRALWVTNWFGTKDDFIQHVPVIESDYIFLYVLMKIGIIGALLILALLIFMLFEAVIKAASSPFISESALSIGFVCCIVVQSVITAASSVGLLPTVGLTFAFLSDGGSATVVNYLMTYFILFSMRTPMQQNIVNQNKKPEREKVCRNQI